MKPCASPKFDSLEFCFILLLGDITIASWIWFTLTEFGIGRTYIPFGIFIVGIACAVFIAVRTRPATPGFLSVVTMLIPVLIGVVLYFPPDEWIFGGLDPGGYINAGAEIARTGRLVLPNTTHPADDQYLRQALVAVGGSDLPGFYTVVPKLNGFGLPTITISATNVVPHGFQFYSAILALGYAIGGIWVELLVTPILAIAGLIAFFLAIRRLFGWPAAALASFLLAIDPAQVWFARYPDAEILVQFLFFGGFLAFVAMLDSPSVWLGVLAGITLGEIHLAKIEDIPLIFVVTLFFAYQWLTAQLDRRWIAFLVAYYILTLQAALHAILVSYLYTTETLRAVSSPRFLVLAMGAAAGVTLLGLLAAFIPGVQIRVRNALIAPFAGRLTENALPILIVILALYAYFIRPLSSSPFSLPFHLPQMSTDNNQNSFVRLGWFLSPFGILIGTLGWAAITRRALNRRNLFPLLAIATDIVLFLNNMEITPVYYWAARRWIPLVIPGFCLGASYLLLQLHGKTRRNPLYSAIPLACSVILCVALLRALRPVIGYVEYRGAVGQLSTFAATFPANSLILFPNGDAGIRLSVPLRYLFQRTSIIVPSDPTRDAELHSVIQERVAHGRPVYWVMSSRLPGPEEVGMRGEVVAQQTISVPEKIATRDEPPGMDGVFQESLTVWQLTGPN